MNSIGHIKNQSIRIPQNRLPVGIDAGARACRLFVDCLEAIDPGAYASQPAAGNCSVLPMQMAKMCIGKPMQ